LITVLSAVGGIKEAASSMTQGTDYQHVYILIIPLTLTIEMKTKASIENNDPSYRLSACVYFKQ
jgi:hypothetical protein